MRFFTADWYLYHKNILRYCSRPYETVEKMQKAILDRANRVMTEDDTLYVLGDVTMEGDSVRPRLEPWLRKMVGKKVLVLGNHDRLKPFTYLDMGFSAVHTSLEIDIAGRRVFLCHDPAWVQTFVEENYNFVLCGHVLNLFGYLTEPIPIINVGVDVRGDSPRSEEEILEFYRTIRGEK